MPSAFARITIAPILPGHQPPLCAHRVELLPFRNRLRRQSARRIHVVLRLDALPITSGAVTPNFAILSGFTHTRIA